MKVAIVHDFLREYGGGERVVEALHDLFPDAPVYVAFTDESAMGEQWKRFADWDIRQSWISKIPFYKALFSPLRVLAPAAFRSFDFSDYDVVISSSNAYFAKAITVPAGTAHICYCHTPPRSLYGYSTMTDWKKNAVIRVFGTLINHVCRVMDVRAAQDVDVFIANSQEVQRRIQKFYRRDSVVINPPVQIPVVLPKTSKKSYFLHVNRLAVSKHPDFAVQVATELNLPLKFVGTGKMLEQLKAMAGPTVEFLGGVSDQELHELYAGARALLYPVEDEDFGIVPVEAMGYGVPVIAHCSGGPTETIIGLENSDQKLKNHATGVFFDELTADGLKQAVEKFLAHEDVFNAEAIHRHAKSFNYQTFQTKIKDVVKKSYKEAKNI